MNPTCHTLKAEPHTVGLLDMQLLLYTNVANHQLGHVCVNFDIYMYVSQPYKIFMSYT